MISFVLFQYMINTCPHRNNFRAFPTEKTNTLRFSKLLLFLANYIINACHFARNAVHLSIITNGLFSTTLELCGTGKNSADSFVCQNWKEFQNCVDTLTLENSYFIAYIWTKIRLQHA